MKLGVLSFIEKLNRAVELFSEKVEEINSINYFPVIDHDTGDNIYSTLKNALSDSDNSTDLVNNLIFHSKGNSGIILGRALADFLSTMIACNGIKNSEDMTNAVINARNGAFKAVLHPKEKTILTFLDIISHNNNWDNIDNVVSVMNGALNSTIRDGEYDAGAKGLYYLIEFIFDIGLNRNIAINNLSIKKENDQLKFKYCTELILDLFDTSSIECFINKLSLIGDSIAYSILENTLKLHVHTNNPFEVFSLARSLGQIIYKKIDNMSLENGEILPVVIIIDDNNELFSPFKKFNVEYISLSTQSGKRELEHKMKSIKANLVLLITNQPQSFKSEEYSNLRIIRTFGLLSKITALLCNKVDDSFTEDVSDFASVCDKEKTVSELTQDQFFDLFTDCKEYIV